MSNTMKRKKKRRPQRHEKPVEELRIPVEDDEYEEDDDGSLDESDILDLDDDDDEEMIPEGTEGVDFVKATPEQELAGKVFQERQMRLQLMQTNANLENEIAQLRKEVAETRIQKLKDQARAMEVANAQMFANAGLKEGDQLKPSDDGFIVIPKGS